MSDKTLPGRGWYRIENKTTDTADVFLYDEVGAWGTSANDFVKELQDVKARSINVRINSPGGEVFDGLAIFNALRSHKADVTVYIDGLAASAASFIAMAGDRIVAERNASLMIHEAHAVGVGNGDDMRKLAGMLDRMSDTIANIYAERAGGTTADWRARMKTETWFSADEAVTAGLVDEVAPMPPAKGMPRNTWDLSIFNFAGRSAAPDPFAAAAEAPQVLAMVCPAHDTATTEGTWDAGMQEGRMPSPMPVAMAKKMYGWIDDARVSDGQMPKGAGKLPHHEVSADGTPGPANLAGVRNALARLGQSDIPEADMAAVRAHLRAHLDAANPSNQTPVEPVADAPCSCVNCQPQPRVDLPFDAAHFRDLMQGLAYEAPAPPAIAPRPVDLGPAPRPAEPIPEPPSLNPWDTFRAAVRLAANNAPAPPSTTTESPAEEPGFSMDAIAFRTALRRATL